MYAEKESNGFHLILDAAEQRRIAAALSGPVLEAEATRRGLIPTAGTMALQPTVVLQPNGSEDFVEHNPTEDEIKRQEFERDARNLLNPDVDLSGPEQLWVSRDLWNTVLGYTPPELSAEQRTFLDGILSGKDCAGMRAVWSPFLTADQLQLVAERAARKLPNVAFDSDSDALALINSPSETYIDLLRYPDRDITVGDSGIRVGLRYRTPDDEFVTQSEYLEAMLQTGMAVKKDGIIWTLPVVDVRYMGGRTDLPGNSANLTPQELHTQGHPSVTLSTALALQLLHQVIGTPTDGGPNWHIETANGAAYRLGDEQPVNKKDLVEIPHLSSVHDLRQPHPRHFLLRSLNIGRYGFSALRQLDYRAAVSGL